MRARRQLIDDHMVVPRDEQLNRENAGEFKALGQPDSQLMCLALHFRRDGRGRDGHVQDIVAVLVAHHRERHVVMPVAGHQNRGFEREIDEAFQDRRREHALTLRTLSHRSEIVRPVQHGLTVAVIAAGTGFEHRRITDLIKGRAELLDAVDLPPRGRRRTMLVDEGLLMDAVLGHAQQISTLRDGHQVTHIIQRIRINVLELVGEHIAAFGQLVDRRDIVICGGHLEIGHLGGRTVRRRVEHADTETHLACGQGHHAAQLTAADDADCRTRFQILDTAVGFLRQARHWTVPPSP